MPGFLHCVGIKGERDPLYMCVCLDKGRQQEAKKHFRANLSYFCFTAVAFSFLYQQPSGWERRGEGRKELVLRIQETDV